MQYRVVGCFLDELGNPQGCKDSVAEDIPEELRQVEAESCLIAGSTDPGQEERKVQGRIPLRTVLDGPPRLHDLQLSVKGLMSTLEE